MEYISTLIDGIPISGAKLKSFARDRGIKIAVAIVIGLVAFIGVDPSLAQAIPSIFGEQKPAVYSEDELWLARALYSESKVPEEQLLVAWVIRNRVESDRFPDSYEGVVREHKQFSGLNPYDEQYLLNVSLDTNDTGEGWDSALEISSLVYNASGMLRPFSYRVWHFYSPISVSATPAWAEDTKPVHVVRNWKDGSIRFAFYESVR